MAAEPGWYADPQGPGRRWWDGASWTEYTSSDAAVPEPAPVREPAPVPEPVEGPPPAYAYPIPEPVEPPPAYVPPPVLPAVYSYTAASASPVPVGAAPSYGPPPVGVWRSPVDDRPVVRNLADAVRVVFSKYAQFDGRATRSEYWYWVLFLAICYAGVLFALIVPVLGIVIAVLFLIAALAVIVPNYAVAIRRLRDAGFHWAWIFLALIPLGSVALIVMFCQPSKYP